MTAFPLGARAAARGGAGRAVSCAVLREPCGVSGAPHMRAPGRRPPDRDPSSATAVPRNESHRLACELYLAGQPWPGMRRERVGDPLSETREDSGPPAVGVSCLCAHRFSGCALCLQEQRKHAEWGSWLRERALQISSLSVHYWSTRK